MRSIIVANEILSVLFLIIILCGIKSHKAERTKSLSFLNASIVMGVIFTCIDVLAFYIEEMAVSATLVTVLCTIVTIGMDAVLVMFAYYLWASVSDNKEVSVWYANVAAIIGVVDLILVIVGIAMNNLYFSMGTLYFNGAWFIAGGMVQILLAVYMLIFVLANCKAAGARMTIVSTVGIVVLGAVYGIRYYREEWAFAYIAIAIMLAMSYIMVQGEVMYIKRVDARLMTEHLHTDSMTGLYNRMAYDDKLSKITGRESIAVMFCSLNGLKNTNDTLGFVAGDALIIKLTNLLKKYFDDDQIYRIGGDEFVALVTGSTEAEFNRIFNNFRIELKNNSNIASMGYSIGTSDEIMLLSKSAEQRMYLDKNEYYIKSGRDRRR